MTRDERADAYYMHAKFVQRELLVRHSKWSGHAYSEEARKRLIAELTQQLDSKPYDFKEGKAWHNMDFASSFRKAMKQFSRHMGDELLKGMSDILPILKDFVNSGLHGDSFAASFMHTDLGNGKALMGDGREIGDAPEWTFPLVLSMYSLEMVASEFGERNLIDPMLRGALSRAEHHPRRWVEYFPTALVGLDLSKFEAPPARPKAL